MSSEGYIKFNCTRVEGNNGISAKTFKEISKWRQIMYESGLIGYYSNGIGYGNISIRAAAGSFYISGTATGRLSILEEKHYALVTSWSFGENSLKCMGSINASAESLSHAAIYESLPTVGAVIHIHHKGMWDKYLNNILTTSSEVMYGTPEMAMEIKKIAGSLDLNQDPFLVMGGHEEGIFAWGESIDDTGETIMKYYNSFLKGG